MGSKDECVSCFLAGDTSWCLIDGKVGLTGSCLRTDCASALLTFTDLGECEQLEQNLIIPHVIGVLIAALWAIEFSIYQSRRTGRRMVSAGCMAVGSLCLFVSFSGMSILSYLTHLKGANKMIPATIYIVILTCVGLTLTMIGALPGLFAWSKAAALVSFSVTLALDIYAAVLGSGTSSSNQPLERLDSQSRFLYASLALTFAVIIPPFLFSTTFLLVVGLAFFRPDEEEEDPVISADKAEGAETNDGRGRAATLERELRRLERDLESKHANEIQKLTEEVAARKTAAQDLESVTEELRMLKEEVTAMRAQQREVDNIEEAIAVEMPTLEYKLDGKD